MGKKSWPLPWEICGVSLSEQKQALRSADSFFIWRSLRCGGVQRREGEREIGGGVGARGGAGGLVLVVCVSVMNVLCNGTKLNFKPRVLEERHLAPPLPSTGFNLFTAAESFYWSSDFRARSQQGQSVLWKTRLVSIHMSFVEHFYSLLSRQNLEIRWKKSAQTKACPWRWRWDAAENLGFCFPACKMKGTVTEVTKSANYCLSSVLFTQLLSH